MSEKETQKEDSSKVALLRKAAGIVIIVFFCAMFLFVGIVLLFAKLAAKNPTN